MSFLGHQSLRAIHERTRGKRRTSVAHYCKYFWQLALSHHVAIDYSKDNLIDYSARPRRGLASFLFSTARLVDSRTFFLVGLAGRLGRQHADWVRKGIHWHPEKLCKWTLLMLVSSIGSEASNRYSVPIQSRFRCQMIKRLSNLSIILASHWMVCVYRSETPNMFLLTACVSFLQQVTILNTQRILGLAVDITTNEDQEN